MLLFQIILHPTDFSATSQLAFQVACSVARDYKAQVLLLHVLSPPATVREMDEAFAAPDERFRKAMHDLQQLKSDHSDIRFDYLLREGDPAQEILATANQRHCDLIVIGTHGKKGLQRVIVGSVAEDVLRRAYCPVLAVRAPAD